MTTVTTETTQPAAQPATPSCDRCHIPTRYYKRLPGRSPKYQFDYYVCPSCGRFRCELAK